MNITHGITLMGLVALLPAPGAKEATRAAQNLEPLAALEGNWRGTVSGRFGDGESERSYEWVLGGHYLQVRNESVLRPRGRPGPLDHHEDWGFFSFDQESGRMMLREFHNEGIIHRYRAEDAAEDGVFVFVSEQVENNLMEGMRARMTLRILADKEIEEVFELARPGADFEVCVTSRLKRID